MYITKFKKFDKENVPHLEHRGFSGTAYTFDGGIALLSTDIELLTDVSVEVLQLGTHIAQISVWGREMTVPRFFVEV